MADDDVPPVEMSWIRSRPDALDAALSGDETDADLLAVVAALRSAYLPEEPLSRSAALNAFCETGVRPVAAPVVEPSGWRTASARAAAAVAAFAATVTGKVVLGSAIAAAGVGGMHAAEVIDVPFLPNHDRPAPAVDDDVPASVLPPVPTDPVDVVPPAIGPDAAGQDGERPGEEPVVESPAGPVVPGDGVTDADDERRPEPAPPAPPASPAAPAPDGSGDESSEARDVEPPTDEGTPAPEPDQQQAPPDDPARPPAEQDDIPVGQDQSPAASDGTEERNPSAP